jgi:hypothetical protein
MKGIILGTVAGILLWLLIGLALYWAFFREIPPAFSLPDMTVQEKRMVKAAIKRHGDFPITREGERGIYYMTRGKERIRL